MNWQIIIAALFGAAAYALGDRLLAQLWHWRRRRQSQRKAEAAKARRELVVQNAMFDAAAKLDSYPFVLEPSNNYQAILAAREIVVLLRSRDRRCFSSCESESSDFGVN